MRAYIMTSGVLFALLFVAHVARAAMEGLHVLRDPFFAASTLAAAGLCVWACRLLLRRPAAG